MKKFAFIAGGLSAAVSIASYGLGYDSLADEPAGTKAAERHALQFTTEASECAVFSFCAAVTFIGSEFQAVIQLTNQTTCTSPTGTCTAANVQDTYSGTTGTASSGASPVEVFSDLHRPDCPVGAAPCRRDTLLNTTFDDWHFTTAQNGKINGGFIVAQSSTATEGFVGVFIFPDNIVRTYRGSSPDLNAACASDPNQDFTTCWNNPDPITGPLAEQRFDYVTAPDADFALGKVVPVPAFAAAVLGLGLVGVTVLTGRHRRIK